MDTINGQSAAKPLKLKKYGESSTTSHCDVASSGAKRGGTTSLVVQDIVWSQGENLEKISKKYNFIYKTTDTVSGEYYIGRHSTDNLLDGYLGSGNNIREGIKVHGRDRYIREIMYHCISFSELVKLEVEIVNEELLKDPKCMNIALGGLNFVGVGKDNPNYGNKWSEEQKRHLSEKITGRYAGKLNPFYGKKHSDEIINMLSKNASKRIGNLNPFYGRKHSKKSLKKMSESTKLTYKNNPHLKIRLRESRLIGTYHTPNGVYDTAKEAGEAVGVTKATILRWVKKDNNKITGNSYNTPEEFRSSTKTWREMGFYFTNFSEE